MSVTFKRWECIKSLVENHEEEIQVERPRHRWEDNIRMDLNK